MQQKIRVLRVITRTNIGGPSIHVRMLLSGLDPQIFYSRLVTGKVSKDEGDMSYIFTDSPVKPVRINTLVREIHPLKDMVSFFRLLKIIATFRPHIIHTHMSKAGTLVRLAAIILKASGLCQARLVHTFHGHIFEGYFGQRKTKLILSLERWLARRTEALIALTEGQRQDLRENFGLSPKCTLAVIPLGLDLNPFKNHQDRGLRKGLGINKGTLVGIVGRLVPIKNHELFLEAAKILLSQGRDDLWFLVVGDGERRNFLESLSESLGIGKKVIFTGWIKDMPTVYTSLDALVMTSLNEGTPVSIIEAMASGTPVVSTGVGGVKELLGDTISCPEEGIFICKRGILCRDFKPVSMAKAIDYCLRMDIEKKNQMIREAKDFALNNYSKERLFKDIQDLYQRLLDKCVG